MEASDLLLAVRPCHRRLGLRGRPLSLPELFGCPRRTHRALALGENEAEAQWDGVLTVYDVADSAHAEGDVDQKVENWADERDVGPLEVREEALTRLNLSERDQHLDLGSLSVSTLQVQADDVSQRIVTVIVARRMVRVDSSAISSSSSFET